MIKPMIGLDKMIKTYKRNLKEFEDRQVRAMQFVEGQTTKAQLIAFLNHVELIEWREDDGGVYGLTIYTHEAFQPAEVEDGDFIFRGLDGEWCSCEEDEFNELFVEVSMDNTLVYIIFLEDLSCFTKREEPSTEEFEQSRDGYLDILRVDKDGRVCRYIGPQQHTESYWEQVDSFEVFMAGKNK